MSVETIRDIPVIVEHRKGCSEPMDFEYTSSGFPFDNSGRRTRDPLEDIAQRHPEFAQHLQGFPRRGQRGGGDQNQDDFLRRRFERPFASGRFERFGFPFDRDDFEREPQRYYEAYPECFENFQNQHPQSPQHQQSSSSQTPSGFQQYPPQYSQEYQPQPPQDKQQHPPQYQTQASQSVSQGTQTDERDVPSQEEQTPSQSEEVKSEGGQTRGRPIQQSNTCDLSQHQPPDESLNDREQRSMSAPPENKRFTSSVNIPMGVNQENGGGIGAQTQAGSGSTERVIPIHVEGRDDPVVPNRFAGASQAPPQSQQPQPERIFNDSPRQQETIFGRRPETFTQFMHRDPHRFPNDWSHSFGSFPEDDFSFRRSESPNRFAGHNRPQANQPQQTQQNVHRPESAPPQQAPKQPQQQPQPQQEPPQQPQPQPQKQPPTPLEQIQAIQKDVASLVRQVEAFNGAPKDKNYLYLDEMLTRNLLKLDNVDTQGQDSIRSARKEAIKFIEKTIGLLEVKAAANVAPKGEKMEVVDPPKESQEGENMEAVVVAQPQEENTTEAAASEPQPEKMEVAQEEGSQEGSSKSGHVEQKPEPADDAVAKSEEVAETEEVKEVQNEPSSGETPKTESTEGGEEVKPEVKEGEKKEKKKIKKKVSKEDKEKKQ